MHDARATNAHMKAERAKSELRRGGYVMLRLNNGEAALFYGAEFADSDTILNLSRLAGSGPLLVLTANRIKSLGRSLRRNWPVATIALASQDFDSILILLLDTILAQYDGLNLVAEQVGRLQIMRSGVAKRQIVAICHICAPAI